MAPLLEHDEADWWRVVDTNLGGTFHLVEAVLPHMRRLGAGASSWFPASGVSPAGPRRRPTRRPGAG